MQCRAPEKKETNLVKQKLLILVRLVLLCRNKCILLFYMLWPVIIFFIKLSVAYYVMGDSKEGA